MQAHHLSQEDFLAIVEAGIQAPSADNRHPLLFDQVGDVVRVWGNDEFRGAPFHRRILSLLSLGAVAENMVLRARDCRRSGRGRDQECACCSNSAPAYEPPLLPWPVNIHGATEAARNRCSGN